MGLQWNDDCIIRCECDAKQMIQSLFTLCAVGYLLIYAFEGAIRYGLYNVGLDNAILLRDVLITVPLALLFVCQAFRVHIHPAFYAFACIIALHGMIAVLNLRTTVPAIYGAKLLINVLFGFIAARQLTQAGKTVLGLFALIWLFTLGGVILDKFIYTFPWMGLETHIGGIRVDVSRGWDIDSGFEKRAAGFSRSSISAAMLLPTLALVIAPRVRSWLIRAALLAVTVSAVALTTQKGALVAVAVVGIILSAPAWSRYSLLCTACLAFAIIDVALPLVTGGLLVGDSGGVFSFTSFDMRIVRTWPEAWEWILHHEVFPFGVGLGGIGGAQRFYAANFFNPSDNFFIFLYANFGLMGIVYLAWTSSMGLGLPRENRGAAIAPLAVLAFNLAYGAALSMLEDQVSALFIGAATGMLWQLRQTTVSRRWSDPYRGPSSRSPGGISPIAAADSNDLAHAR
jgi:hypothetical protein